MRISDWRHVLRVFFCFFLPFFPSFLINIYDWCYVSRMSFFFSSFFPCFLINISVWRHVFRVSFCFLLPCFSHFRLLPELGHGTRILFFSFFFSFFLIDISDFCQSWDMAGRTCYACPSCQPAGAGSFIAVSLFFFSEIVYVLCVSFLPASGRR